MRTPGKCDKRTPASVSGTRPMVDPSAISLACPSAGFNAGNRGDGSSRSGRRKIEDFIPLYTGPWSTGPADQAGRRDLGTCVVTGTFLRILDAGCLLKGPAASCLKYRYPESRPCAGSFRVPASTKRRRFRYATSRSCFTGPQGREMGSLLFNSPLPGTGAAMAAPSR